MERLSTGFTCGELGSQEDDEGKDATLGGHLTTTTRSQPTTSIEDLSQKPFSPRLNLKYRDIGILSQPSLAVIAIQGFHLKKLSLHCAQVT